MLSFFSKLFVTSEIGFQDLEKIQVNLLFDPHAGQAELMILRAKMGSLERHLKCKMNLARGI